MKKHYKKRKIYGQIVVEVKTSLPVSERLTVAPPTSVHKDKSKWNKATERRKNKVYSW